MGCFKNSGTVFLPKLSQLIQCLQPLILGEIGPPGKGFSSRQCESIERPTAAAGDHRNSIHIELVHIGTLLAIYLYTDKIFVHYSRNFLIFKGFLFHHMAPVTGGIADTHNQRLVFLFRFLKRFLVPGMPVHWIMRMLQQVRAALVNEEIRHVGGIFSKLRFFRKSILYWNY